ncbi:hypothetical protein YC2023_010237 [Brassica napus]
MLRPKTTTGAQQVGELRASVIDFDGSASLVVIYSLLVETPHLPRHKIVSGQLDTCPSRCYAATSRSDNLRSTPAVVVILPRTIDPVKRDQQTVNRSPGYQKKVLLSGFRY